MPAPEAVMLTTVPPRVVAASNAVIVAPAGNESLVVTLNGTSDESARTLPMSGVVGVKLSAAAVGFTLSVYAWIPEVHPKLSTACTLKAKLPVLLGVPARLLPEKATDGSAAPV